MKKTNCGQLDADAQTTPRHRRIGVSLFLLAAAVALFIAGCDTPQNSFSAASDHANKIRDLYLILIVVSSIVLVVVTAALVYAMYRFRARPGQGLPRPVHGHTKLEVGWTVAFGLILAVVLGFTFVVIRDTTKAAPAEALQVEVTGHQWWWEFRYPELNVVTANELRLPVDRPVSLTITSTDVIHSFWAPHFAGKIDAVPGRTNPLWFTPEKTGLFQGQCAEFCGVAHAQMRFQVVVLDQDEFQAWAQVQQRPAVTPETALAKRGAELLSKSFPVRQASDATNRLFANAGSLGCFICHSIKGTVAAGTVGPDLTHVGGRNTLGAGVLSNTPENLALWLADTQNVKPGNIMPTLGLSEEDIAALVAYLQSLK
jgi:cytochrome c oxidase subunit 2